MFIKHEGVATAMLLCFVLLFGSSPAAIPRLVVAVVIWETVYGMFERWTQPHVSEKISERSPLLTNVDAATSVMFEALVFWICAALDHVRPRIVGGRSLSVFSGVTVTYATIHADNYKGTLC